jgi:hypothetical protein
MDEETAHDADRPRPQRRLGGPGGCDPRVRELGAEEQDPGTT